MDQNDRFTQNLFLRGYYHIMKINIDAKRITPKNNNINEKSEFIFYFQGASET